MKDPSHTAPTYPRFRAALEAGEVDEAFLIAKGLPGLVSMLDGLALTLLANECNRPDHFQACAARWLARLTVERKLKLDDLMAAGSTFQAAERGDADNPFRELSALL